MEFLEKLFGFFIARTPIKLLKLNSVITYLFAFDLLSQFLFISYILLDGMICNSNSSFDSLSCSQHIKSSIFLLFTIKSISLSFSFFIMIWLSRELSHLNHRFLDSYFPSISSDPSVIPTTTTTSPVNTFIPQLKKFIFKKLFMFFCLILLCLLSILFQYLYSPVHFILFSHIFICPHFPSVSSLSSTPYSSFTSHHSVYCIFSNSYFVHILFISVQIIDYISLLLFFISIFFDIYLFYKLPSISDFNSLRDSPFRSSDFSRDSV